jgi:hypothetical protein
MVELSGRANRPAGACRIISCLPYERGPLQYRVQWHDDPVQRVVSEADLRASNATNTAQQKEEAAESAFRPLRVVRR